MAVTIDGSAGITNDGGYTGDGVVFADTTPANTLVTTTGGNVGIGTNAPNRAVSIYRASSPVLQLIDATTGTTSNDGLLIQQVGVDTYIENAEIGFMQFRTSGTERARIDSSGNLLISRTDTSNTTRGTYFEGNGVGAWNCYQPNGGSAAIFKATSSGTQVGSIQLTTTTTAYNTSSDYRLKESITPMTGALAKVAALKPCTYKWKVDGSDGQGFIAHELAEVEPGCVTGEKDAVDAEGNPQYQGIDVSFLVATLTAAIQELKAIVDAQGAEIAALENQS